LTLFTHGFLTHRQGTSAKDYEFVVKDLAYTSSFGTFKNWALHNLVSTHLALNREAFQRKAAMHREQQQTIIIGDKLSFDMSRVSSKEVMLLQLFSDDILCALPLQAQVGKCLAFSGGSCEPLGHWPV
jgi:hypothetical protein